MGDSDADASRTETVLIVVTCGDAVDEFAMYAHSRWLPESAGVKVKVRVKAPPTASPEPPEPVPVSSVAP